MDQIRNAEDLLPEGNPVRQRLGSIREDLDAMRRRFGRDSRAPRFDLVFDQAIKPLTLAAEELKLSIREKQSEFVFGPESEGEVPAQYKAQVAEYFKALSEMK
ncbi:MAG: hypothetical protein O7G87_07915 [bacterium]|nr:hypothetical protein [bacterium]